MRHNLSAHVWKTRGLSKGVCADCKKTYQKTHWMQKRCPECKEAQYEKQRAFWDRPKIEGNQYNGIRVFKEGRRCKVCHTILSIYNPAQVCYCCHRRKVLKDYYPMAGIGQACVKTA